uniref:Uncharacterized protein n=1 Tax=Ditylenchus dipsaci TaxID=166011 RepID=A0A915CS39_9BILA
MDQSSQLNQPNGCIDQSSQLNQLNRFAAAHLDLDHNIDKMRPSFKFSLTHPKTIACLPLHVLAISGNVRIMVANELQVSRHDDQTQVKKNFLACGVPYRRSNAISQKLVPKLGFLKEISEFEIDPPFLSPASSSSSADNSPMMLSPAGRPASARLYRRRNKLAKDFPDTEDGLPPPSSDFHRWMAEDDFFGSPISRQRFLHNAGGDLAGLTPPSSRCSPSSGASSSSPTDHSSTSAPLQVPQLPTADSLDNDGEEEEDDSNLDLDVLNLRNALKARTDRMAKYQQMRSFNVDSQGRIVDCGFRNAGGKLLKPVASRSFS